MSNNKLNLGLYILLACLWSGSFIAIKIVVDIWPSLFGAAIRVAIAFLSIGLLMLLTRKKMIVKLALIKKVLVMGLFSQGIPFALLFWGEQFISPGLAGILNATVSIWTYMLALIFLPDKTVFSLLKFAGLLLGILGVITIFAPIVSFSNNMTFLFGSLAVLGMAISYAIGALLNQYFLHGSQKLDFLTNVFYQHLGSLLFLLLLVILTRNYPLSNIVNYNCIFASLYLGVFATALAFSVYYHLIREWDALHASTVLYLVPALALLWDYLFFHNIPSVYEIFGIITILFGVGMIQLENFMKFKKK